MCTHERRACRCGRQAASLIFRDNILSPGVLIQLYCPECSTQAVWDPESMVRDCGWIIEYDMLRARYLLAQSGLRREASPEFLLEEGYLSWQGLSPRDHDMNSQLHRELAPLIQEDMKLYLKRLKDEWLAHVAELKAEGWRKALRA